MKWKEYLTEQLNEGNIKITKSSGAGSSLYKVLSDSQNKAAIKNLSKSKNQDVKELIDTIDDKYSHDLKIKWNNVMFTLYGANGKLRISAGGTMSEPKVLDQYLNIDEFINDLKKL